MNLKYFLFIVLVNILFACQNENSLLGDRYFEAGDYQKAIEAYNEYLKLKPRHVKSIYNRGRCYQELGQYDRAMVDFNKVVDLDEHVECWWRLAFEDGLLGAAAAGLLVGERDGLDPADQVG